MPISRKVTQDTSDHQDYHISQYVADFRCFCEWSVGFEKLVRFLSAISSHLLSHIRCSNPVRCRVSTPPETNSSHLKIDGWKTVLSLLGLGLFSRGEVKIFGEATASKNHFGILGQCYRKKKSTLKVWRRLGPDFGLNLGT